MLIQEKSHSLKMKYLLLHFGVAALLIFMWTSSLTAETEVTLKNNTHDLSKTILGTDQTNLMKKSEEYDFKEPLPNIIRGPDDAEKSDEDSSVIFAYVILGLFACLFILYVMYTILDFWVLSRRGWTQRVGEPEHEQEENSELNSSNQTHTEATSRNDVICF